MQIKIDKAPLSIDANVFAQSGKLRYVLLHPHIIEYTKIDDNNVTHHKLIAPQEFKSDGLSVPKIPVVYGSLKELSIVSAIFHDLIYRTTSLQISKEEADEILWSLLIYEGVNMVKADLIYEGVHLFGDSSYQEREAV